MSYFKIIRLNAKGSLKSDLYYQLITLSWPKLLIFILILFIFLNLLFASLYYLIPNSLNQDTSFLDCFYFSVHTMSTVGYGHLHPVGHLSNLVASLEIFVGLILVALLTGLFFNKFSLPRGRFLFSKKILYTNFNGSKHLLFRLANARSNKIMNAEVQLNLLRSYTTDEGIQMRKIYDLKLNRPKTSIFTLSLLVLHKIEDPELLEILESNDSEKLSDLEFIASITGHDDTYGQTIHDTHIYSHQQILKDHLFKDILTVQKDGSRIIDFQFFNQTVPLKK